MAMTGVLNRALAHELRLARGTVVGIDINGHVRVCVEAEAARNIACEVLRAGDGDPLWLAPGQKVLVALSADPEPSGVILGGIGPAGSDVGQKALLTAAPPTPSEPAPGSDPRREITIEAGEELVLRCGEASIQLTRDGKIIIRGEHILSRAKGTQRIKGGSVAIN